MRFTSVDFPTFGRPTTATRIPPKSVSKDDRAALQNLERDLKTMVFGQDKAIDALAAAIRMSRSGLGNE